MRVAVLEDLVHLRRKRGDRHHLKEVFVVHRARELFEVDLAVVVEVGVLHHLEHLLLGNVDVQRAHHRQHLLGADGACRPDKEAAAAAADGRVGGAAWATQGSGQVQSALEATPFLSISNVSNTRRSL